MASGRPREFDETQVLERAMQLFWSQGFERSSVAELLQAMGISRQSLYDTFGSKRELFVRAIEHYRATHLSQGLALLEREGSPIENVKALVGFFEDLASDSRCRGCLIANALVEVAPRDAELAALLDGTLELLQARVQSALERSQQAGEIAPGRSPRRLASALTNAMLGLAVSGKLQRDGASLHEIYSGTLELLD